MKIERTPMFLLHRGKALGPDGRSGQVGKLVWHPDRPSIVSIALLNAHIDVTLDGFTTALCDEHVEPFGDVAVWPHLDSQGREWLVVDLDGGDTPDTQIVFRHHIAAGFVADVALAACVAGVESQRFELSGEDWYSRPVRREDGAL